MRSSRFRKVVLCAPKQSLPLVLAWLIGASCVWLAPALEAVPESVRAGRSAAR